MDEFLVVGTTPTGTQVYLSELSRRTLDDNGLGNDSSGLYLYEASDEASGSGIRVLATLPCLESAFRMIEVLGLRLTPA